MECQPRAGPEAGFRTENRGPTDSAQADWVRTGFAVTACAFANNGSFATCDARLRSTPPSTGTKSPALSPRRGPTQRPNGSPGRSTARADAPSGSARTTAGSPRWRPGPDLPAPRGTSNLFPRQHLG